LKGHADPWYSRIEGNGVCTVIVEDASRFARDLVAQELGILLLINRGVRVLTANGDNLHTFSREKHPPGVERGHHRPCTGLSFPKFFGI
jgi:hypothetical protein